LEVSSYGIGIALYLAALRGLYFAVGLGVKAQLRERVNLPFVLPVYGFNEWAELQ
jgi:hypothetical protein